MTKKKVNSRVFEIISIVISLILAAVILVLSALTIINISNSSYDSAPTYLIWIFVAVALLSVVLYLKNRTKINLIRAIVLIVFNIAIGIIVIFAQNNPILFSVTAGLYCLTIVVSRVFSIVQNHSIRNIVFNSLIILFAIVMGIGIFVSPIEDTEQVQNTILVECVFIAAVSFIEALGIALSHLKFKVLARIVMSTFSIEILFGLLGMMVCFSLIFMKIEPSMPTFPEALWYCFAIVTTIGFGDYVAITPIGRVLSVILGMYGIVVVAVVTSIVVNFYNETSGKRDKKELKTIEKEEEKKKE